jgi:hypothetical protein
MSDFKSNNSPISIKQINKSMDSSFLVDEINIARGVKKFLEQKSSYKKSNSEIDDNMMVYHLMG